MLTALLMSVMAATLVIPSLASRDRKPSRGLKRTVISMLAFIAVWGYCVDHYYYRLLPPEDPTTDEGE